MSNGDTKKRTSASLRKDTLDKIEAFRKKKNLDNRSEAIETLVHEHPATKGYGGLMSALMGIAGEELPLQLRQLAWFTMAAAVMVLTYDAGVVGGGVWLGLAGLFVFLSLSTMIGAAAGFLHRVDPDPVGADDTAESPNEVEA